MRDRVVVIGAGGFIGSGLLEELARRKFEAIGVSRRDCDLLDRSEVSRQISSILKDSTLIYAAGKHRQHGDTLDFFRGNIEALINVLGAAEEAIPRRILFLSSMEVYGDQEVPHPIAETTDLKPSFLYAAGKISQEYLVRTWAHSRRLPVTALRLPGIYGYNDKRMSVISKLFAAANDGGEFFLLTNGAETRDYVQLTDLTACIGELINVQEIPPILNIGTGTSVSINKIISLVESATGRSVRVIRKNPTIPGFNVEIDTTLLKYTLPTFKFDSVEVGIRKYANPNINDITARRNV